jgi:hypothetical protein
MSDEHAQDEERTTAHGLARYAFEYITAASLVDEHQGKGKGYEHVSPVPAYFLALHGRELTLKAFLRHHGVSAAHLRSPRNFGHDIRACYRKAKELGLHQVIKLTADDMRAMLLPIDLDHHHALRYIRTGLYHYPSWAVVEPLVVRLHKAVAGAIGARSFTKTFSRRQ